MIQKLAAPKQDTCKEPAYLFWKLQSRLTKLANQLDKLEKEKTALLQPQQLAESRQDLKN